MFIDRSWIKYWNCGTTTKRIRGVVHVNRCAYGVAAEWMFSIFGFGVVCYNAETIDGNFITFVDHSDRHRVLRRWAIGMVRFVPHDDDIVRSGWRPIHGAPEWAKQRRIEPDPAIKDGKTGFLEQAS
jgi:hypothetical protein